MLDQVNIALPRELIYLVIHAIIQGEGEQLMKLNKLNAFKV